MINKNGNYKESIKYYLIAIENESNGDMFLLEKYFNKNNYYKNGKRWEPLI